MNETRDLINLTHAASDLLYGLGVNLMYTAANAVVAFTLIGAYLLVSAVTRLGRQVLRR